MISVGTAPKRFVGKLAKLQELAIRSWFEFTDDIILFAKFVPPLEGVRVFEVKTSDKSDAPIVSELFKSLDCLGVHPVLMYTNADIVFLGGVEKAVRSVLNRTEKNFLIVGQRWDCDWEDTMTLEDIRRAPKKLHAPTGIDYFIFPKGFWGKIPPFVLGRTCWDNWLLSDALRRGAFVVDATQCIWAVHLNHDWSHLRGGKEEAWSGPEAVFNRSLLTREELERGRIDRTKWILTSEGEVIERG